MSCTASDDVGVDTLETIGNWLNVIGVVIALSGLVVETHRRRLPVLGERGQRAMARLKRAWRNMAIREPQRRVFSGSASGGYGYEGVAFGMMPQKVDPEDPVHVQIEAFQHNMREMLKSSEAQQALYREDQSKQADALLRRIDRVSETMRHEAQAEKHITSRSVRVELWGVAVALLGTGLSAMAQLI